MAGIKQRAGRSSEQEPSVYFCFFSGVSHIYPGVGLVLYWPVDWLFESPIR